MTADKGSEFVRVRRDALQRARDTAMEWTVRGRIPECGEFGGIAQDLDAMLSAAPPAESQPQGISGDLERFDFVDPALVVPWLAVIYSEFLPDEDNLGRRSDIEMRAALDYAMKFVAGHRKCQPDWFQKQALEAYSLLAAEGWAWDAPHGWTRPPIAAPDHIADARKMVAAPGDVEQALEDLRESSIPSRSYDFIEAALRSQGQADAVDDKYAELIYAVGNKYPGESRHETALRYIRQAEAPTGAAALAQQANKEQPPNA